MPIVTPKGDELNYIPISSEWPEVKVIKIGRDKKNRMIIKGPNSCWVFRLSLSLSLKHSLTNDSSELVTIIEQEILNELIVILIYADTAKMYCAF